MKNLLLIIIAFTFIACKKQSNEQPDPQTPVDVFYIVKGSRNTPKHVTCYLWNSNQQHETLELIGKIDTVITAPETTLKITQDHGSYIYAKVTFDVTVLEGSDNLDIGVSYDNQASGKVILNHYASCPVDNMGFHNEYVELYKQNQKQVK